MLKFWSHPNIKSILSAEGHNFNFYLKKCKFIVQNQVWYKNNLLVLFFPMLTQRLTSINSDAQIVFQKTQVKIRRLRHNRRQGRGRPAGITITKAGPPATAVFTQSPVLIS